MLKNAGVYTFFTNCANHTTAPGIAMTEKCRRQTVLPMSPGYNEMTSHLQSTVLAPVKAAPIPQSTGFSHVQLSVADSSKPAWWTFGVSTAILMARKQGGMAMTLGERIYKLRTEKEMSQGDLADALEVSRQSVSKWETNGSVPELDKLVKLSEIFGVSLDELVLDKKQSEPVREPEPKVIYVERQAPGPAHKTAGVVLLCFAALVWLLVSLFGDILAGLLLASPFAACGLICLLAGKNVGLWCLWVIYAFFDLYFRFATGTHWGFALQLFAYRGGWTIQLIIAWIWLLCFAGLTAATVLRFKKSAASAMRRNVICTAVFWAIYALIWVLMVLPMYDPEIDIEKVRIINLISSVFGAVREVFLAAALVFSARSIASVSAKRKRK